MLVVDDMNPPGRIYCLIFVRQPSRPADHRIVILTNDNPECEVMPLCSGIWFSKCSTASLSARFIGGLRPCRGVSRTVYERTAYGIRAYAERYTRVQRTPYVGTAMRLTC